MESGSNKLTVINAVINKTADEKSTDPDTGALNSELQSTLNEQPKTALEVLNEVMSRPPPASPETDEAPAPHIPSLMAIPVAPPEVRNQDSIETGTKSEQPVKHNSVASQLITSQHPAMNSPKSQDLNTAITNLSKVILELFFLSFLTFLLGSLFLQSVFIISHNIESISCYKIFFT